MIRIDPARPTRRVARRVALALAASLVLAPAARADDGAPAPAPAPEQPAAPDAAAAPSAPANAGDTTRIHFTLPFEKALAEAKEQRRLLFLKPIYGGVDDLGARDYRCGTW